MVDVENSLKKLIENKKYPALKDVLSTMNPSDIANVLDDLDDQQAQRQDSRAHDKALFVVRFRCWLFLISLTYVNHLFCFYRIMIIAHYYTVYCFL